MHPQLTTDDIARFWNSVDLAGDCWVWTRAHTKQGYGEFCTPVRQTWYAHRVAWLLATGEWPGRSHVLHRCDNPQCVRFSHLFLGTQQSNVADMIAKGRNSPPPLHLGESCHTAKLTVERVLQMRERNAAGESAWSLAKAFGISHSSAKKIVNGSTWRHISPPQ